MSDFSDPIRGARRWDGSDVGLKLVYNNQQGHQGRIAAMPDKHPKAPPKLRPLPAPMRDASAAPGRQLFALLVSDIAAGTADLPSPQPQVAMRIARGVRKAGHGRRVARLLAADPALSAKTLRAACAAARLRRPRTLPQVVDRLDRHQVADLVETAVQGTCQIGPQLLREAAVDAWKRSLRVSTIAYLLANLDGRFDAEEAALAGLLHNLGELALLGRAAREDRPDVGRELADACRHYGAEAGRELARAWGFPSSLQRVAGSFMDWDRAHEGSVDMADLILVAQLHARLGQPGQTTLPRLQHMPAFGQLSLGEASPRFSLGLLEAANNALALTERQLAIL